MLELTIVDFNTELAYQAGLLRPLTKGAGLSRGIEPVMHLLNTLVCLRLLLIGPGKTYRWVLKFGDLLVLL